MALERVFDVEDVNLLLAQNASPPNGSRNAALIIGGVYWGLTPLELSLVDVKSVIAPGGDFYRIWVLPAESSFNGEEREVHTEDHVLPFFENYAAFRLEKNGDSGILNRIEALIQ